MAPWVHSIKTNALSDRCGGRRRHGGVSAHLSRRRGYRVERLLAGSLAVRAVARDVSGLRALVAHLAGGAQRAAVGGGAVARDVAQLTTGIALHGLSLAVTGKVVGTAALVASRSARVAAISTTEAATETAATSSAGTLRSRAVALMAIRTCLSEIRAYIRQGGRAGCSCSSGRRHH